MGRLTRDAEGFGERPERRAGTQGLRRAQAFELVELFA
jgi:hypothetical protein